MVYKNFLLRISITLMLLIVYFGIAYIKFDYILYLAVFIYFLLIIEVYLNFSKLKYVILTYLIISFLFLLQINFNETEFNTFHLMIVIVISFDSFSYLIGRTFGTIKILKYISPNKTLEGLIGGTTLSILAALIYSFIFKIDININLILFILIIIISSFIGDVIESYFKRVNNIKNSSSFLPGHGGFFDRFDSFILTIIVYNVSSKII